MAITDAALAARDRIMSEKPKTLVQKLAEVTAAVDRIPKRGRNEFHGYDYATEADIAEKVRPELAKRHLVMFPDVQAVEWREGPPNKEGKATAPICLLNVLWSIKDGETGEEIKYHVPGAGQDSGDKGVYKALTGSQKYALLKLLQIPTGDDPEREDGRNGRDVPGRYKGKAPRAQSPRGEAPPAEEEAPFQYEPPKSTGAAQRPPEAASAVRAPAATELQEIGQLRETLRLKASRLADALQSSPEERKQWASTYLGTTDTRKADPAALSDLCKYLAQRCRDKGIEVPA